MSRYDKQAERFLKKTGATIKAEYMETGKHFDDDKEVRDIYSITITRGKRAYTFRFGQSLRETTGHGGNAPSAYDVLSCTQKYHPGTFEDFCAELGYDVDSRKAEKVYNAAVNEYTQLSRLFTDKELDEMI